MLNAAMIGLGWWGKELVRAQRVIFSLQARRKLRELLAQVRPRIAHAHNIYHHLSPSILPLLRKRGIPVVMTVHDLKLACPAYTMMARNEPCERCRGGRIHNVAVHRCIKAGLTMQVADNENSELQQFTDAVSAVEHTFDFIVIDTPGTDSYLMRLAHSMADTLVTPINDSFLDFDVLGTVDPQTYAVTGESHYAEMVCDTRRKRRQLDGASSDWIVVRNRLSMIGSRNKQLVADGLNEL